MEGGGGGGGGAGVGGCLGLGHGGEAQIKGTHTHGGRYVQYNVYGNLFEVSAKYVPPIRPVGRGACGIIWCVPSSSFAFVRARFSISGTFFSSEETLHGILLAFLVKALQWTPPPPGYGGSASPMQEKILASIRWCVIVYTWPKNTSLDVLPSHPDCWLRS
jgi:hypothetical protein